MKVKLTYFAALIALLGFTVFVSIKDEHAAQHAARESTNGYNCLVAPCTGSEDNKNHPQSDIENPKGDSPSWYGFFRWPTGTTTWAIILTLLAIAEQTNETRKSAEASKISAEATKKAANAAEGSADALINIEKAWILLAGIEVTFTPCFPVGSIDTDKIEGVRLTFINYGKTPAWTESCSFRFFLEKIANFNQPFKHEERMVLPRGVAIPPGKKQRINIPLEPSHPITGDDWGSVDRGESTFILAGCITYRDAFFEHTKQLRETHVCYEYRVTPKDRLLEQKGSWIIWNQPKGNKTT